MKTLWHQGASLDQHIAAFTVWDDRQLDAQLATQDVLGSLAHVKTLIRAEVLTAEEGYQLSTALVDLYAKAQNGELAPGPHDEDIHSTVERLLTERLGPAAGRLHTARSRNDQVALDVALWIRQRALDNVEKTLQVSAIATEFAEKHADILLPGMTHLQPAMPSSVGLWALSTAALLLQDAKACQFAWNSANLCPLGSAAGYGVPAHLVDLDRDYTAGLLGFEAPARPVTSVQAGRGRQEASLLFALSQTMGTLGKLASDVVLYVNPHWGWLRLEDTYTTGSSIMPQKKNPDVMELVRAHGHSVRASLTEVLSLPASMPSGYHRDYQLFKAPLMRGVRAAEAALDITGQVFSGLHVVPEACQQAMRPELYATQRALELVAAGTPFRDAYRQVAHEVSSGTLPDTNTGKAHDITNDLQSIRHTHRALSAWLTRTKERQQLLTDALLNPEAP